MVTRELVPDTGAVESAVRLIGGETPGGTGPLPADHAQFGAWLMPMLRDVLPATGRILVAGAADPELVEVLARTGPTVDLLVRALPEARAARLRLADAGVRVLCGGLDRITPAEGPTGEYDAVLALAGTADLCGLDGAALGWSDTVALLVDRCAPGGLLALLVDNGLGLRRLTVAGSPTTDPAGVLATVPAPSPVSAPTPVPVPVTGSAPAGRAETADRLAAMGVRTGPALAVYPGLVCHEGALSGAYRDDGVATLVAATCADGLPAGQALTDPARLARDAVRHGLGAALAPAWIMLGTVEAGTLAEAPQPPARMVFADRPGPVSYWSVPQLLTRTAEPTPDPVERSAPSGAGTPRWQRRPLDAASAVRSLTHVCRDPAALTGPLPAGASVEELLLAACAEHDLSAVRDLVRGYLRWLRQDASTGQWRAVWAGDERGEGELCAAGRQFPVLDTVLITAGPEGVPVALDPSWTSTLRVPVELVFIRALQRFSHRLLAGGHRHPWPAGLSSDRLAVTLAATAEVCVSPRDLAAATAYDVYLTGPLTDMSGVDGAARYAELRERWSRDPAGAAVAPGGYREAVSVIGQLSAALSESAAQLHWLDETVAERDRQLSALGAVRRSVTYRIGYLFTGPYHLGLRLLRRELRRWRS